MSDSISRAHIGRLGLAGLQAGPSVHVPWPDDRAAEAQAAAPVALALTAAYAVLGFATFARSVGDRAGLTLEMGLEEPRIVRLVSSSPDEPLELITEAGDAEAIHSGVLRPADEPGVIVVDLRRIRNLAVFGRENGVALNADDSGLAVTGLSAALVEPLAQLDAPAGEWLASLDDPWVKAQAATLMRHAGAWNTAAAAGLVARLVDPSGASAAKDAIERLVRGEVDPDLAAPRRWAQSLGPAQKRTLLDLALAELDVLHAEIADLMDAVIEDRPHWRSRWQHLCQRRDDVESVRLILHEAAMDEVVSDALLDLDRQGELLRLSVPWSDDLADERARRVGAVDPLAWWGTYTPEELT